jgi:hypothetical protein
MNAKKAVPALVAAAALAAVGATAAAAGPGRGDHRATIAQRRADVRLLRQREARLHRAILRRQATLRAAVRQQRLRQQHRVAARGGGVLYRFAGELTAVSSASVSLNVEAGNHAALVRLAGKSAAQSFAVGAQTEYLLWTKGVPKVVGASALKSGDWVVVSVRAPRAAGLDRIEQQPAGIVSDRVAKPVPPGEPLFLFRGRIVATGSSSVTVNVAGGNDRALRLLVGADDVQTFATGPETIFLLWQGKVPTVVTLADLKPGDPVTVRIRAKAGSGLGTVTSTPAVHVGEHEPANAESGV